MTFHIFWTMLMLFIFIGIILWAFSGHQKKRFESAAALALEPDDSPIIEPASRSDQVRDLHRPSKDSEE